MIKLNLKILILVAGVVFMLISINKKYGKYKEVLNNRKILIENKRNLESKIVDVVEEKKSERERIIGEYNQILALTQRLSFLSIKNESEFKKIQPHIQKQSLYHYPSNTPIQNSDIFSKYYSQISQNY